MHNDLDRSSPAAGRGLRCAPWLGLASLGALAAVVSTAQHARLETAQARAVDSAIQVWRGGFEAGGSRTAAARPFDVISLPGTVPTAAPPEEYPLPFGDSTAAAPLSGDDEELSSLAMMPSPGDILGAPPAGNDGWSVDLGWSRPGDETQDESFDRDPPDRHTQHKVGKGETLAKVLEGLGIGAKDRAAVLAAAKQTPELAKLKAGQVLHARLSTDGGLVALHVPIDTKKSLRLRSEDGALKAHRHERRGEKRLSFALASVQSSLYADGQSAGLSDAQIAELASIFGWDVDFALGLRAGDRFSVLYEAEYIDGKQADDGDILAAEFVNRGKTYRAVRFEEDDGSIGYYAPDGTSMKQAFLRNPLKLAKVSSGFSLSRFHPVLQERRAHKGVDYSAPIGTPVKATGGGVVQFSGRQNGYGNVVELQHGEKYTTVYGHLSRFAEGISPGTRVEQGQIIGYVGRTGIATGPHLHYEFRIAGQHRDPLTVKLPPATPLKDQKLAEFRERTAPLIAQLENLKESRSSRAP